MNQNEEPTLEEALVSSIAKPNLTDLASELAEVGLDHFLTDGVLRDIPVLGTLVGLYRTVGVIRDRLFAAKVIRFLIGLAEIPLDDRERFLKEHAERTERQRLGETLVLLLDRLDDMQKPEALSRLFAAYVRGQYNLEMFRRLAMALDRISLSSVSELRTFYRTEETVGLQPGLIGESHALFAFAGLVNIEFSRVGPTGGAGARYVKNHLGALFLEMLSSA